MLSAVAFDVEHKGGQAQLNGGKLCGGYMGRIKFSQLSRAFQPCCAASWLVVHSGLSKGAKMALPWIEVVDVAECRYCGRVLVEALCVEHM
jgi:hypothetical protein